jgi:hypothetical protein
MLKTLGIAAFILALCCPAHAGEIPTPPAPQPQNMTVQEQITTDEAIGAADTLTQTVLTLLVSILP